MRDLAIFVAAASLLLCIACGSDDGSPNAPLASATPVAGTSIPTQVACTGASLGAPGITTKTLSVAGTERRYTLALAQSYEDSPAPLLMAFMPFGGERTEAFEDLHAAALADGYIVVLPEGSPGGWNSATGTDADFANDLLSSLRASACIDRTRVYLVGLADGGTMAQSLACARPDSVSAVAMVSAAYLPCSAPNIPLVAIHGSADMVVPYEGGVVAGLQFAPVHRSVSEWARAAGCDGLPTISAQSAGVELSTYKRCRRGDGVVLLYTLLRGGHEWPADAGGFSATAAMIEFFTHLRD